MPRKKHDRSYFSSKWWCHPNRTAKVSWIMMVTICFSYFEDLWRFQWPQGFSPFSLNLEFPLLEFQGKHISCTKWEVRIFCKTAASPMTWCAQAERWWKTFVNFRVKKTNTLFWCWSSGIMFHPQNMECCEDLTGYVPPKVNSDKIAMSSWWLETRVSIPKKKHQIFRQNWPVLTARFWKLSNNNSKPWTFTRVCQITP